MLFMLWTLGAILSDRAGVAHATDDARFGGDDPDRAARIVAELYRLELVDAARRFAREVRTNGLRRAERDLLVDLVTILEDWSEEDETLPVEGIRELVRVLGRGREDR